MRKPENFWAIVSAYRPLYPKTARMSGSTNLVKTRWLPNSISTSPTSKSFLSWSVTSSSKIKCKKSVVAGLPSTTVTSRLNLPTHSSSRSTAVARAIRRKSTPKKSQANARYYWNLAIFRVIVSRCPKHWGLPCGLHNFHTMEPSVIGQQGRCFLLAT